MTAATLWRGNHNIINYVLVLLLETTTKLTVVPPTDQKPKQKLVMAQTQAAMLECAGYASIGGSS